MKFNFLSKPFPRNIAIQVENEHYDKDQTGMSNAGVLIYANSVLKIQELSEQSKNEYQMLCFLSDLGLAPRVICHDTQDDADYLLMEKCQGKMLCDSEFLTNQKRVVELATNFLKILWGTNIKKCPVNISLSNRLKLAEYNVRHNLVDLDNVESTTFGANGCFRDPEDLLKWLIDNQPSEELVVTHGDFCLPNIFFDGMSTKVIDVGRGGVADKYQDIALLYRSLRDNLQGEYGTFYSTFDENEFFATLGEVPNKEKLRYYMLLDELF